MRQKIYPLDQCRLYKVTSPADLASRLDSTVDELEQLAIDAGNYRVWKTDSGRTIEEPKPRLQQLHARVHTLLSRIETPSYLHSAIKGRSYISNALAHLRDGNLIKVDVKKFFQSVPASSVFKFFRDHLKCAEHTAGLAAKLLTIDGHLPTGSSSSPIMSYYCFKGMFDEIAAVAARNGLTMTCYVDDIAVSGPGASRKVLFEIRRIITRYGLKSHKVKYFPERRPKIITGVVITKNRARLPNRRHLLIKQHHDLLLKAATPEDKIAVLKVLTSRVHEAAQIDRSWLPKARVLDNLRAELKNEILHAKNNSRIAVSEADVPSSEAGVPWDTGGTPTAETRR